MSGHRRKIRRASFRVNGRGWVYLVLAGSVAFAAALKYPGASAGETAFPVFPRWDLAEAAAQSAPRR